MINGESEKPPILHLKPNEPKAQVGTFLFSIFILIRTSVQLNIAVLYSHSIWGYHFISTRVGTADGVISRIPPLATENHSLSETAS